MASYWVSQERYFCKYCKVWLSNHQAVSDFMLRNRPLSSALFSKDERQHHTEWKVDSSRQPQDNATRLRICLTHPVSFAKATYMLDASCELRLLAWLFSDFSERSQCDSNVPGASYSPVPWAPRSDGSMWVTRDQIIMTVPFSA